MTNILVTTMGTTWQIIPELLGFTNPDLVDLYRYHPRCGHFASVRRDYGIQPVDECWIVATHGNRTENAIQKLNEWYAAFDTTKRPSLKIRQVADVDDLASEEECRTMAEAILRIVLHASEQSAGNGLLLSLAGGRKTMSTDMQHAANLFGCNALLHVISKDPRKMNALGPSDFSVPLPPELEDQVSPLITGIYRRNPILDLETDDYRAVRAKQFPLPFHPDSEPIEELRIAGDFSLLEEIEQREKRAAFLLCNYSNSMMSGEASTNFLALYSLPSSQIEKLKAIRIGTDPATQQTELQWLKQLPKAELHCHLGGIADTLELIEIAAANRPALDTYQPRLADWLDTWRRRLETEDPLQLHHRINFKDLRMAVPDVPEPLCTAAFVLLFENRPALLDAIIFGPYQNESQFCEIYFDPYEKLGDLQGSGLLQSEASIRTAVRILARKARKHNVRHLEIRCSPANYTRGGLNALQVVQCIENEMQTFHGLSHSLIFIASRHGSMERIKEHIELGKQLLEAEPQTFPAFRGFDLAGNETAGNYPDIRDAFMPMMEKCMHFTIHAGEIQPANSIWQAVYHLNAERIGHGLKLKDDQSLLEKFKDRDIALEMCPSSNVQIIGYRDNYLPGTDHLPRYPLQQYLQEGLRVTVNTDNPGISRTDFTNELHRAARLSPGGLRLWDILILVRNGFKAAFADRQQKHQLLLAAERDVIKTIEQEIRL